MRIIFLNNELIALHFRRCFTMSHWEISMSICDWRCMLYILQPKQSCRPINPPGYTPPHTHTSVPRSVPPPVPRSSTQPPSTSRLPLTLLFCRDGLPIVVNQHEDESERVIGWNVRYWPNLINVASATPTGGQMEARDGKIVDAFNTISESRREGTEEGGRRAKWGWRRGGEEEGREGGESGERHRGRKRGRLRRRGKQTDGYNIITERTKRKRQRIQIQNTLFHVTKITLTTWMMDLKHKWTWDIHKISVNTFYIIFRHPMSLINVPLTLLQKYASY